MPLYTSAQVQAKIEALDAAIAKAQTAQSYGAGSGVTLARGDLAAMYRERDRWIKEYERLEATESGGNPRVNLAQFARET